MLGCQGSPLFSDWRYCESCESNSPPRSFHCSACDRCILKRDHHCMFTGKCVGHFTYRNYIYLLFYCWLEALFAAFFCHEYTWTLLGDVSFKNLFSAVFPMVMFVFGILDFYTTYVTLMSTITTGFSIFLTLLGIYHSKHVIHGLTTYERRHGIYKYDLGWKKNVENTFGKNWKVSWLFPFIPSPLPGNGLQFDTSDTYEDPKVQWQLVFHKSYCGRDKYTVISEHLPKISSGEFTVSQARFRRIFTFLPVGLVRITQCILRSFVIVDETG